MDLFPSLGDGAATPPATEEKAAPAPDTDLGDIFGLNSEETPKEETPAEETPAEEKKEETPAAEETPKEETPKEDPTPSSTKNEEDELEKLIREAGLGLDELSTSPDLSDKDKKKVQELADQNSELQATVESLTRQLDAAREQTNRSLETNEELRIYKPLIDKMEKEPQLMMFVKYFGSKNDVMKQRLTDICKDMLQSLTGIDVYSLVDEQTNAAATAFGKESEETTPPAIDPGTAKETAAAPRRPRDKTFGLF